MAYGWFAIAQSPLEREDLVACLVNLNNPRLVAELHVRTLSAASLKIEDWNKAWWQDHGRIAAYERNIAEAEARIADESSRAAFYKDLYQKLVEAQEEEQQQRKQQTEQLKKPQKKQSQKKKKMDTKAIKAQKKKPTQKAAQTKKKPTQKAAQTKKKQTQKKAQTKVTTQKQQQQQENSRPYTNVVDFNPRRSAPPAAKQELQGQQGNKRPSVSAINTEASGVKTTPLKRARV